MAIGYLDCFSGISGDMLLGALIDAGADVHLLERTVNALPIEPVEIRCNYRTVQGIRAADVEVAYPPAIKLRNLAAVETLLTDAPHLPTRVRDLTLAAFRELARAEAQVHGLRMEEVHFHEVGALDTLVDILGCIMALHDLGVDRIVASPIPWSTGCLQMAHGIYPLPAPATVELLRGIPCYGVDADMELVTPTGASLLRTLAEDFGALPAMVPRAVGYGAGTVERADVPNLIRLIIGDDAIKDQTDMVSVIETEIDDMPAEHFSFLAEQLMASGVLDFYFTPVYMKKNRPGTLVTLLTPPGKVAEFIRLLLNHSSTLGVRHWLAHRTILPREVIEVSTRWGKIQVKKALLPGQPPRLAPEYEDCRRLAQAHHLALETVYREAIVQAMENESGSSVRCTGLMRPMPTQTQGDSDPASASRAEPNDLSSPG